MSCENRLFSTITTDELLLHAEEHRMLARPAQPTDLLTADQQHHYDLAEVLYTRWKTRQDRDAERLDDSNLTEIEE